MPDGEADDLQAELASYEAAQQAEKAAFSALLYDCCGGITDPPQKVGRPRLLLRDSIIAACFEVYSTLAAGGL